MIADPLAPRPRRVCFVCLGNICRSPTAQAAFAHLLALRGLNGQFTVESFGTGDWHAGEPADPRMRTAARAFGLTLDDHRARQFQPRHFADFDLVIAMDRQNLRDLEALAPDNAARAKLRLFRSWDPEAAPGADTPDPWYGGGDGFADVVRLCLRTCAALLNELA